jgi:hypothetical protein
MLIKFIPLTRIFRFVFSIFMLGIGISHAETISPLPHYNQVIITRTSSHTVNFEFSLNLVLTLKRLLVPEATIDSFLKQYTNMSAEQFKNNIQPAINQLQLNCIVYTPQGSIYKLTNWKIPNPEKLQSLMNDEIIIRQVPPEFQAHLDPIMINAELQSSESIARITLQMKPSLMPLWVINTEGDKFWMTDKIPVAVIKIP